MKTILFILFVFFPFTISFAQDQTVNGDLILKGKFILPSATDQDKQSPGIVGVRYDNFLYKGKYLNHYGFGFYKQDSDSYIRSYISDYFGIDFFTSGKLRLTILGTGRVGIGTDSPQSLLDVNGTIRSKEVKIEATGWPDFVFDKDYKLPSLEDVEIHINEKGTLPNIPSEKDVKENGIDVGEIQAKLLQKIEELTLYVIDLKKENEEQNTLIEKLLKEKDK
ncbi:MAG: hypothetical protein ACK5KT_04180 [Dysgonomonas sp.]